MVLLVVPVAFSYFATGGRLQHIAYISPTVAGTNYNSVQANQSSGQYNSIAAILVAYVNSTSINNNTLTQQGNFNVQAASSGTVAGVLEANASGSSDILDLKNGSGTNIATFGNTGNVLLQTTTNSMQALQIQNSGGATVLSTDTTDMRVGVDSYFVPMSTPTGLTASATNSTGGSLLQSTTYYYKVTAIDSAGGETQASSEVSKLTGNTTNTNTISLYWNAVVGASGYKLYRGTSSNSEIYLTTLLSNYSSGSPYVDIGTANPSSAVPPATTTAVVSGNNNANPTEVNEWQTSPGSNISSLADSPVSKGDVIVVSTEITASGVTVNTVANGGVTTWNLVEASPITGSTKRVEMWMGVVTTTGAGTISLTFTGSGNPGVNEITAIEYTAANITAGSNWNVITAGANTGSSTATITYPTLTTQGNNELYVGYGQTTGTGSAGSSTGFSYIVTNNNNVLTYDASLANATAYTPTANTTASSSFNAIAAIIAAGPYNNSNLQVTIGSSGTPTGQLYVSGTVPTTWTGLSRGSYLASPYGIYVVGHYAYSISSSGNTLDDYDVSDPSNPTFIGQSSTSSITADNLNNPRGIYVQGHYAFIASYGNSELVIYDISNPAEPSFVGQIGTNLSGPKNVYVSGNYAYVANWTGGSMVIFNVSNPATPTYVSQMQTTNLAGAFNIMVQGNYAYVTSFVNPNGLSSDN